MLKVSAPCLKGLKMKKASDSPIRFSSVSSYHGAPLLITFLYVSTGLFWIYLSDRLLMLLVSDHEIISMISIFKGGLFVVVTALLLYFMIRRSHKALLMEQLKLKQLINFTPDLIWLKNPDGYYLACNRRFEQFFGASEGEIIGKTDYDFVDPELADLFMENDRIALMADTASKNEELITFASDGHRELLETIKTPLKLPDGTLIGVLGIGRDITLLRDTTNKLADSVRLFRSMVETVPVGIVMYCNATEDIEYLNPILLSFFGEGVSELTNISQWWQFAYPDESYRNQIKDEWDQRIRRSLLDGGQVAPLEAVVSCQDKSKKIIEFSALVTKGSTLVFIRDLTGQKRVEQELLEHKRQLEKLVALRTEELTLARDRAKEADRAKTVFMVSMGHGVRTSLTSVIGMTHLAMQGELSQQQRRYLQNVTSSAEEVLGVINDIFDYSRLEAGQMELEQNGFRLSTMLELLSGAVNQKLKGGRVQFRVICSPEIPPALIGDQPRLLQLLTGIIENAICQTRDGSVNLMVTNLPVTGVGQAKIGFQVSDTGGGISQEQQQKMFDPFARLEGVDCDQGWSGLKLAICKKLVELMGGKIRFSSVMGEGSRLSFTLPLTIGNLEEFEGLEDERREEKGGDATTLPETLPGIDLGKGLTCMNNDPEFYIFMLQRFLHEKGAAAGEIARLLEEGRSTDAARVAHSVRSAAGSIGATALMEDAAELEHLLEQRGENLNEAVERFGERLQLVTDGIRQAFQVDNTVATPVDSVIVTADGAEVARLVEQIAELLEKDMGQVMNLANRLGELLQKGGGAAWFRQLSTALNRFDLDAARQLLEDYPGMAAPR